MTGLKLTEAVLVILVYIELVRLSAWALKRLCTQLDARYEHRRQAERDAQDRRAAERAHLIDVGNAAKFGLLRNAGVINDEVP